MNTIALYFVFLLKNMIKTIVLYRKDFYICLFLCNILFLIYFPVLNQKFISFDDQLNITENPHVRSGISIENIKWALQFTQKGDKHYWHPLTSISHMLDCHFFSLNPTWHHLMNLLIHIVNTILLYILLYNLTSARWKSFFVTVFFALHPINVESIAWIAERKNLLSSMFWFLTMITYLSYVKNQNLFRYIIFFICMLLGLLCKPILVTLPFVLLILDIWPLNRIHLHFSKESMPNFKIISRKLAILTFEKIPLFILSIFWIFLSSLSMNRLGVSIPIETIPLDIRIANAIISYPLYIWKIVWPFNLAIFYPFPTKMLPLWQIGSSSLLIISITVVAIFFFYQKRWIIFGWFWFIGILFPTIGLMQNGLWPAMADRWAYLPMIGISIIIAWSVPDLLSDWRHKKKMLIFSFFSMLILLATATRFQIHYWTDDKTIFRHAIDVTSNNFIAYNNLGGALLKDGNFNDAIKNYYKAIDIFPEFKQANFNLAKVLSIQNRQEEAKRYLNKAIKIDPSFGEAYHNLGSIFMMEGNDKKAAELFYQAIRINPKLEPAFYNLGIITANHGKIDESIHLLSIAVLLNPEFTEAQNKLNTIKAFLKKIELQINKINLLLKSDPNNHLLYYKLGVLLKSIHRLNEAEKHFRQTLSLKPDYFQALTKLAQLYTEQKEYDKAISLFKKTIELYPKKNNLYYNIGCLYSKKHMETESISWLKKAIKNGFDNFQWMKTDPDLDNIRTSLNFQELLLKQKQ